jgi:hypothetical protein
MDENAADGISSVMIQANTPVQVISSSSFEGRSALNGRKTGALGVQRLK